MILITGGGGFIGLNLARELIDCRREILLISYKDYQVPSFLAPYLGKQIVQEQADINELPGLCSLLKKHSVTSIIHAASLHEGTGTLYDVMHTNLQGTTNVLEAARLCGVKRITFISSIGVYLSRVGRPGDLNEDMDLPVASDGWISATKKAGEQICQVYAKECGLALSIVRPAQVWGPLYMSGRSPIQAMMESAVSGKPADLRHVNGNTKGVYVYVRDCGKAISRVHLAPSLKYGIHNISDGERHTLDDFAVAIKKVIPDAEIRLGPGSSPGDLDLPRMSIDRIKQDAGFVPEYDINRGVSAYLAWLKDGSYV